MKKLKMFIVFAIITLFIVACPENFEEDKYETIAFELKNGNSWTYLQTESPNNQEESLTFTKKVEIIKDTLINNLKYSIFEVNGKRNDNLRRNGNVGQFIRNISSTENEEYLLFKYPFELNDEWEYSLFGVNTKSTVSSTYSYVEVPAGSYGCYVYEIKQEKLNNTHEKTEYKNLYFVSPFGIIKTLYLEKEKNKMNFDTVLIEELISSNVEY